EPAELGDGPRADREVSAPEPEAERGGRQRGGRGHQPGARHGQARMRRGAVGEPEEGVAAEAPVGLLADRDEARVAGEQVPHLGEPEQRDELHQDPHRARVPPRGQARQHGQPQRGADQAGAAGPRGAAGADGPGARGRAQATLRAFANRPWGRRSSTARKTRCPVRMPQPGDSLAPTVCATPSTAPPTSVPQSEPSPPMITASNAKSSRSGPLAKVKVVRMPRNTPATATMPRESAMARP